MEILYNIIKTWKLEREKDEIGKIYSDKCARESNDEIPKIMLDNTMHVPRFIFFNIFYNISLSPASRFP